MLSCCWFFIFQLFTTPAIPHSILLSKPEIKDRKVNLALETVLEFNNKDNAADMKFLDNIQKFIGKVRNVIDKNNDLRRDFNTGKLEKFTDFIHNVIEIIYKYEDHDLESFFSIVSDEIRKYHYRGCKFHELTENYGLRKFIASELDALKNIPAKSIRNKIMSIAEKIEDERYNNYERELVDFINSLYRQNSVEKFRKILLNIDDYRLNGKNNTVNLATIIREGIRSIIFDHYTELNHNARTALKSKIEEYWKYLMDLSKTLVSQLNAEEIRLRSYNVDHEIPILDDTKKHMKREHKTRKSASVKQDTEIALTEKTDIYINLKKHVKVKYETPYYEGTVGMNKVKKMTFLTLYPKFVYDLQSPKYRVVDTSPIFSTIKQTLMLSPERDNELKGKPIINDSEAEAHFKAHHKKRSTTRKHKEKRTMRQMYIQHNLDLNYGSYANKFITKTKRRRKTTGGIKRMSFLTLYPEFEMEITTKKTRTAKKQFSLPPVKHEMQTLWYEKIQKPYQKILRDGESRVTLSTDKILLEVVTIKPHKPIKVEPPKKFKYEVKLRAHDVHRKQLELINKKSQFGLTTSRLKYQSPKYRVQASDNPSVEILSQLSVDKLGQSPSDINNINIKSKIIDLLTPDKGFEAFDRPKYRRSYANSVTNIPKDSVVVDKRILTKIQELERELKDVKTQIINDTKTIKDLNTKVHEKAIFKRDDHKLTQKYGAAKLKHKHNPMKEVVFDVAAQINLENGLRNEFNIGGTEKSALNVIQLNRIGINAANFGSNKDKVTKYELDRTTLNKNKNDYIKGMFPQEREYHEAITLRQFKHANSAKNELKKINYMEPNRNIIIKQKYDEFDRDKDINRLNDNYNSYQYKNDHEYYTKPGHKKVKQTFELQSFKDDIANAYSNKMSKTNQNINRNTHKLDTYHTQSNELKSYSGVKKIGYSHYRNTTNLFDDTDNSYKYKSDQKYYKNSNHIQTVKHRFELKGFTDDIRPHYKQTNHFERTTFNTNRYRDESHINLNHPATNINNKIKEKQHHNYDRSTINRIDDNDSNQNNVEPQNYKDINQRKIQHRFIITNVNVDKANIHTNNMHEGKSGFAGNNLNREKKPDYVRQKYDLKTYNKPNKKYDDANEHKKEQEKKYYPESNRYSLHELDEIKNMQNRERIYDSDFNNGNITRNSDKLNQNYDRKHELNIDHDEDRKNILKYKKYESYANETYPEKIFYDTNTNNNRQTSDNIHDTNEQKLIKLKGQIQKDNHLDIPDVFKTEDHEIYKIKKTFSGKEEYNADNRVYQEDNEMQQNQIINDAQNSVGYLNISLDDVTINITPAPNSEKSTFQIINNNLYNPIKNIVSVNSPITNIKQDYKNEYAYETNKSVVAAHDLHENHILREGRENIRPFQKQNEIENDLNSESVLKKNNHLEQKAINNDYNENTFKLSTTHKKNDVVFKADSNKDIFNNSKVQSEYNSSSVIQTTKSLDFFNFTQFTKQPSGDSTNQYYHRAQQERQIVEDKLNNSSDSGTMHNNSDKYKHKNKYTDGKETNYTTTFKTEPGKGLLDLHVKKENITVKSIVVNNETTNFKLLMTNKTHKDSEKEKSNKTSVVTNSTAISLTLSNTIPPAIPSSTRTFNNFIRGSTSHNTDKSVAAFISSSTDLRKDNHIPTELTGVALGESNPSKASELGIGKYGDTRRDIDLMPLGLLRQSDNKVTNILNLNNNGTTVNYTVDSQRRKNIDELLDPEVYDYYREYQSLDNNITQNVDIPMPPSSW